MLASSCEAVFWHWPKNLATCECSDSVKQWTLLKSFCEWTWARLSKSDTPLLGEESCWNLIPAWPHSRFDFLPQVAILIHTSVVLKYVKRIKHKQCNVANALWHRTTVSAQVTLHHFGWQAQKRKICQCTSKGIFSLLDCLFLCAWTQSMNHWHFSLFFFFYVAQCKRLDGGLVKLKEAAVQLAELNVKLAEQKIILTEKTAACEALLRDIKLNTEIGG